MAFACCRWHYAYAIIFVTFLVLVVGAGVRATPGVLIAALESEYGWTRDVISGAISINILLYGILGPFVAATILAWGVRPVVCVSLVLLGSGVALATVMPHGTPAPLFGLWGVLVGVGSAGVANILGAVVTDRWFATHKGLVLGFFSASNATGSLLFAPPLAWLVEHTAAGWRSAAWVMGAAAGVVLPFALLLMRDRPEDVGARKFGEVYVEVTKEDEAAPSGSDKTESTEGAGVAEGRIGDDVDGIAATPQDRAPVPSTTPAAKRPLHAAFSALRDGLRSRDFWLLAGSFFVCGASTNGLIGVHFIPACVDSGMMTEVMAAGLLSSMGAMDIFGTLFSGWLTDRSNPRLLLFIYYGLRGVALAFLPTALSLGDLEHMQAGLWPYAVVYGLDWIATVPPTKKLCDAAFPGRGAIIFGWCLAAHQIGAAVAAAAAGAVRTRYDRYDGAFYFSGGLCMATAIAVWFIGWTAAKASGSSAAASSNENAEFSDLKPPASTAVEATVVTVGKT